MTDWFSFSLYRIAIERKCINDQIVGRIDRQNKLVFPAASSPSINSLISLFEKSLAEENVFNLRVKQTNKERTYKEPLKD